MKKVFIVLAMLASMQLANAQGQVKNVNAAKAAVEAAQKAADDAKKNTKTATWIKLGQTLVDAYNAPAGNVWSGMSQQDLQLLGGGEKASSEEQVTINGTAFLKLVYGTKNLYFGQDGKLAAVEVTKPIVDNALGKALDAYKKAAALDEKGQKTKDIAEAIKSITNKYVEDAYSAYTLGNMALASTNFEKAYRASQTAPYSNADVNSLYNAGVAASYADDANRAKTLFQETLAAGYAGEGGEVYAKLAEIAEKEGDKETSKNYLEQGFAAHPESQSILVGLINYYVNSGENTDRLFELLDNAKKNEPDNASLYYVEGNIHSQLGNEAAAVAAWDKCATVNAKYEYGFIGKGLYFYNKAVDLQDAASQEMNDAKYTALMNQFEESLKACIDPFEKAFEVSEDATIKSSVAEYLKNACFRFRDSSADMMAKYEKYAAAAAQ